MISAAVIPNIFEIREPDFVNDIYAPVSQDTYRAFLGQAQGQVEPPAPEQPATLQD